MYMYVHVYKFRQSNNFRVRNYVKKPIQTKLTIVTINEWPHQHHHRRRRHHHHAS